MTKKPVFTLFNLTIFATAVAVSGLAGAVEKQELSSPAIGKVPVKSQTLQTSTAKRFESEAGTMEDLLPPAFRDYDDDSSLPYMLTPEELRKFGIRRATQEFPTFDSSTMLDRVRASPVLKIRIQAILTANSDGSEPATITPAEIRQLVDQTNRVWWSSGIEFLFDPEKDVERRNSTLLNQRVSSAGFYKNKKNPNWKPEEIDNSSHQNARQQAGLEIRDKIVVFFSKSFGFDWDETNQEWYMKPAGGFSGHDLEYVFMPNRMPEKNLLAHEIGHYLHLPHPFVSKVADTAILTVDDAALAIRYWVEFSGHAPRRASLVFDGDNKFRYPGLVVDIKDTPPDPDGQIFTNTYGPGAKCDEAQDTVVVPVTFSNGKQADYKLTPDRLNIMSYYKGCHNLGTHHVTDGQIAASRNALINGNRLHLLGPSMNLRPARQKAVQE